jgi:hypothetical protein
MSSYKDYTLLLIKMQGECDDVGKHRRSMGGISLQVCCSGMGAILPYMRLAPIVQKALNAVVLYMVLYG